LNVEPSSITEKMVLGTVQFGMDYGIANVFGKPAKQEVFKILELAWQNGVRRFDTAPGYGSENLLGEFIAANGLQDEAIVLTKIPSLNMIADYRNFLRINIDSSLKNLGCPIDVLFFHDADDSGLLLTDPQFFADLLRDRPLATIGISVYEPEEIEKLSGCEFELAFQFPYNVLDRRFEKVRMPVGKRYARSIFLQGLLVSKNKLRPDTNLILIDLQTKYHNKLNEYNLNPTNFAFSFVANSETADYVLLGVDNVHQLNDIFSQKLNNQEMIKHLNEFTLNIDKNLLDPRSWN